MKLVSMVAALAVVALGGAGCGSDGDPDPAGVSAVVDLDEPQPGDDTVDDDLPEFEEDLEASRNDSARADLALTATADPTTAAPGETVVVTVVVESLDRDFVNAPTVTATLPSGLRAGALPDGCREDGSVVRCQVAPSILSESGAVPVSAEPFEFELVVDPGASGTLAVALVAESLDNPVDNDPNPADNRVDLAVTVG